MNTSDISHPHENYEELFEKAFDLVKQNLFPKQCNDETTKRLGELDDHIEMLAKQIRSFKLSNLTPNPQWIQEQSKAINERDAIVHKYTGKFDIHKDSSTIELFEKLKATIDKRIVQQISKIDKRCILIIGEDSALIKGVVCHVYYDHTCKNFFYIECLGLNKNEIKNKLEQATLDKYPCAEDMPFNEYKAMRATLVKPKESLIDKYENGCTLFLRGLKSKNTLERLAGIIRSNDDGGMLIVSAPDKDNIPNVFQKLCEVIELEAEKQDTPVSTPQDTKEPKTEGQCMFDDQKGVFSINNKSYTCKDYKVYLLFKKLYENQHRRLPKGELLKELSMGDNAESQLFNKVSALKKMISKSPYLIHTQKEYPGKEGGYLLKRNEIAELES